MLNTLLKVDYVETMIYPRIRIELKQIPCAVRWNTIIFQYPSYFFMRIQIFIINQIIRKLASFLRAKSFFDLYADESYSFKNNFQSL